METTTPNSEVNTGNQQYTSPSATPWKRMLISKVRKARRWEAPTKIQSWTKKANTNNPNASRCQTKKGASEKSESFMAMIEQAKATSHTHKLEKVNPTAAPLLPTHSEQTTAKPSTSTGGLTEKKPPPTTNQQKSLLRDLLNTKTVITPDHSSTLSTSEQADPSYFTNYNNLCKAFKNQDKNTTQLDAVIRIAATKFCNTTLDSRNIASEEIRRTFEEIVCNKQRYKLKKHPSDKNIHRSLLRLQAMRNKIRSNIFSYNKSDDTPLIQFKIDISEQDRKDLHEWILSQNHDPISPSLFCTRLLKYNIAITETRRDEVLKEIFTDGTELAQVKPYMQQQERWATYTDTEGELNYNVFNNHPEKALHQKESTHQDKSLLGHTAITQPSPTQQSQQSVTSAQQHKTEFRLTNENIADYIKQGSSNSDIARFIKYFNSYGVIPNHYKDIMSCENAVIAFFDRSFGNIVPPDTATNATELAKVCDRLNEEYNICLSKAQFRDILARGFPIYQQYINSNPFPIDHANPLHPSLFSK